MRKNLQERARYIVTKTFTHTVVDPFDNRLVKYHLGEVLDLPVEGQFTKRYLKKGFLERLEEDE